MSTILPPVSCKDFPPKAKQRIRFVWTCCDNCHKEHGSVFTARLHYTLLKIRGAVRGVGIK